MKINKAPKELVNFYRYINNKSQKYDFLDQDEFKNNLKSYIDYLNKLYKNWFKKAKFYNVEHLAEQIFVREINIKQQKHWVKYQLNALIQSVNRVSDDVLKKSQRPSSSLRFVRQPDFLDELKLLREIVFESIPFIDISHYYVTGKYPNWVFGKRNVMNSMETIEASKNLLRYKLTRNLGDFPIRPTSILLIRQSIELRIKNALGIEDIFDEKGNLVKIPSTYFIDIINNNQDKIIFPIKISILLKIYNWTQYYVHGGYAPNTWVIEWTHFILKDLFKSDEYQNEFNAFGAVKIAKSFYDKIEIEINNILNARSKNKKAIKYKVTRLKSPESIVMNDK